MNSMVWDVSINRFRADGQIIGEVMLGYVTVFSCGFDPYSNYTDDEMKRITQDMFAEHLRDVIRDKMEADALDD